jgi:FKBP-type peptidyl-prolyl cis-trans isomerase SlpA
MSDPSNDISAPAVTAGARVLLHYRLCLEDGSEVETSIGSDPLSIVVGSGEFAEGLETLLLGLKAGERKQFEIAAWQTVFGDYDWERVQKLDKDVFPSDMELEPGLVIGFTTPDGDEVPGVIQEVDDDQVTVDFNHPLAGRNCVYEVELLEVEPAADA